MSNSQNEESYASSSPGPEDEAGPGVTPSINTTVEGAFQGKEPLSPEIMATRGGIFTVLQFTFSLVAIFSLWGIAGLLLLLGVFSMAAMQGAGMSVDGGFLLQSISLAACGTMVLPSAITSYRRMRGNPLPESYMPLLNLNPLIPALALLPVLGLGYLVIDSQIAWLILPAIHILAICLPVLFLVILGLRGVSTGSPQRRTGVFGVGISLGPFVILFFESLALVAAIIFVAFYISSQPELANQLMTFSEQFSKFQGDMDALLEMLAPFLTSPLIMAGAIVFVSVIVPLIEELFKPIGVWFLIRKEISAAEGFAAGALSGAGFAVFESLMLNASMEEWLIGSVVRIGTAVIHITTAAFSGWALALAWKKGRFFILVLTYLAVVTVHGIWNGLAILVVFNELAVSKGMRIDFPGIEMIAAISPYLLGVLTLAGFLAFILMNRSLRRPAQGQEIAITIE